jgi:AraC family transcriptional regulator
METGRETSEERLGRAVDYLESRLAAPAQAAAAAEAAAAAGWSEWHFMRLFQAASGMNVGEYLRRRRLARAAAVLVRTRRSALEVALEAGYESQAAFSRAFAREFGATPTRYRELYAAEPREAGTISPTANLPPGAVPPFEPRLPFEPPEPDVRVESLPVLRLYGIGVATSMRAYRAFRDLPEAWAEWTRRRRWLEVPALAPGRPFYGLCSPAVERSFDYYICVEASPGSRPPPGWKQVDVHAGQYAISRAAGAQPRAIQGATLAMYARWLPASGLERGPGWDIEAYFPGDLCLSELRLPLAGAQP